MIQRSSEKGWPFLFALVSYNIEEKAIFFLSHGSYFLLNILEASCIQRQGQREKNECIHAY